MWTISRMNGVVTGASRKDGDSITTVGKNTEGWDKLVKWNDEQPPEKKLDLSDKATEPPAPDKDEPRISIVRQYLTRTTPGNATEAEREAYIRALGVLVLRALGRE